MKKKKKVKIRTKKKTANWTYTYEYRLVIDLIYKPKMHLQSRPKSRYTFFSSLQFITKSPNMSDQVQYFNFEYFYYNVDHK